jgi:hypothetical protein
MKVTTKMVWVRNLLTIMLFPVFFILHGSNEHFGLLPSGILLSLTMKYELLVVSFFLVSLLFLKERNKVLLFTFCLILFFFFFGSAHDYLKKLFGNVLVTSYSWFLPIWSAIFLGLYFLLRRSKKQFQAASLYIKILMLILFLAEIGICSWFTVNKRANDNYLGVRPDLKDVPHGTVDQRPDIFFIVFDEYTSSKGLKEFMNYDNSFVDSLFVKNNFFVSSLSQSNYNYTPFSLASTFSFNYLQLNSFNGRMDKNLLLKAIASAKRNPFTSFLEEQGYSIVNYGGFDLNKVPNRAPSFFDDKFMCGIIDNQTIVSRIEKDIWWNFSTRNLLTGKFKIPDSYIENKKKHLGHNLFNFDGLIKELQISSDSPKFVYAHFMLPHQPYYMNSDGSYVSDTALILQQITPMQGHLNQIGYSNLLLQKIITLVNRKAKRKRVVVIEGDHGFRSYQEAKPGHKVFMNLNAYYFSDCDYSSLYNGISPVNTFRIILNKYFSQSLPLVRDSSVFLTDFQN